MSASGMTKGRTVRRLNQRLVIGSHSLRQVYEDNAMSQRNTPVRIVEDLRVEIRNDDGIDDGVIETASVWLVHPDHPDGQQQIVLNHLGDERDDVLKALREALEPLT